MTAGRTPWLRAARGTIRFRITALAALAVLLVLSAASVALVVAQRSILTDSLDETLAQQADSVAEQLRAGEPVGSELRSDDVAVQVVGPDGAVLAASAALADLPPLDAPAADTTAVATVELGGASARLLSRDVDGTTIHVAGNLQDVEESTAVLAVSLLVAVPISAEVLAGIVWWSVGRTLRPVEDIRAQVDQISGTRLDRRVPEPGTHDEIARLAHTMNGMLSRLDESAERQRRFVADASHELRSPLARIRSELDVDMARPPPRTWVPPTAASSPRPLLCSGSSTTCCCSPAATAAPSTVHAEHPSTSTTSSPGRPAGCEPAAPCAWTPARWRPPRCSAMTPSCSGPSPTCSTTPSAMPGAASP